MSIRKYDDRRQIALPGNREETLAFAVDHFMKIAEQAIKERGLFAAALSGGSTPKEMLALIAKNHATSIPWDKVRIFWSDERSVGPDHPQSNYRMAMQAGLGKLPLKSWRMRAEKDIEINAILYEDLIERKVKKFDLVMLGMGEDGHTASLFPHTAGLAIDDRLVIANYVPQKETWRMTFTFRGIHNSSHVVIYVLGKDKADMVRKVFTSPFDLETYPIQNVGKRGCKALWILDQDSAKKMAIE